MLQIEYNNDRLEKVCTNAYEATKKYGPKMAGKIQQRISEISAAPSVERCYSLGLVVAML